MRERRFIHPLAGKGVIHVCHGHHLGTNGNLLPLEAVWISPAVPTLMMPAADLVGHLYQRLPLMDREAVQHLGPSHGVGFHDLEFLIGQPARLIENLAINRDFADVVQSRGLTDQGDVALVQAIGVGFGDQPFQKNLRQAAHMHHMQAALSVSELHNMAEDIDHQEAVLLFFVDLLGYQGL